MKVIIEKGEVVEVITEKEGVIDPLDVDENEDDFEYIDTPFGIIKKGKGSRVTREDYEAERMEAAEKAAAARAKRAAEAAKAAAEAERLRIEAEEAATKALAAWRKKYPNKRRSETKPAEDPGEGWEWVNEGICRTCWTRVRVGR